MTLSEGMYGLDSSSTLDYGACFKAGSRFNVRYSAGSGPTNLTKLCKIGEIQAIVAAGNDFIANSEWYETRVTEGAPAGKADGQKDLAFWNSRGLAHGSSIYPSWDSSPTPSLYDEVAAYIAAYNQALAGEYKCDGIYAGLQALHYLASTAKVIKHGWLPESTSFSNLPKNYYQPTREEAPLFASSIRAQAIGAGLQSLIWQTGNHWFGTSADEDLIVLGSNNFGSHLEAKSAGATIPGHPMIPPAGLSRVDSQATLTRGEALVSNNKKYAAIFQSSDGNFVVRNLTNSNADWNSGTFGKSATRLVVQNDGNIVIYRSDGVALWSTKSADPSGKCAIFFQMQDDGNLVAYKSDGHAVVWASK